MTGTAKPKLDPCPFFHPITEGIRLGMTTYTSISYYSVICDDCGSNGPEATIETDAIATWNARSEKTLRSWLQAF